MKGDCNEFSPDGIGPPFGHFLEVLRLHGFTIGVEHHLRLAALVAELPKDIGLTGLKHALCPLLATSAGQQRLFYRLFDDYFHVMDEAPAVRERSESRSGREAEKSEQAFWVRLRNGKSLYWLAGGLWVLLVWLLARDLIPPETVAPITEPRVVETTYDPAAQEQGISFVLQLPGNGKTPELIFYQRHWRHLRLLAALLPLLVLLLLELYRYQRKTLALRRESGRRPDYLWEMRVAEQEQVHLRNPLFYLAGRKLQERLESDVAVPDVLRSIDATVREAGFPVLLYKYTSRPPEYLFLVDVPEHNDHFARFFVTIVEGLQREGAHAALFFYRRDPQVCFRELGGKSEYLADILDRYRNRRLVVAGDGAALLEPATGELADWSAVFRHWDRRALLTPKPPAEWGMAEVTLAGEFLVLPATLAALSELHDYFSDVMRPDLRKWVKNDQRERLPHRQWHDPAALKQFLGFETFQYLCCCAVYPELHWNLTLYLGITMTGTGPDEQTLLKLLQLPWFQSGTIPDAARKVLLEHLEMDRLLAVRRAILNFLDTNPPAAGTPQADLRALYVAAYEGEVTGGLRARIKRALRENNIPSQLLTRDYTLLRLLDGAPSLLHFILPKRFHDLFFEHGVALFGLKSGVRTVVAVLLAAGVGLWFPEPVMPVLSAAGDEVRFDFAHIPAGTFMMGSPADEPGRSDDEIQHQVTLTRGFYLQTTEVTQAQWQAVMGENPAYFKRCGMDCPVENVSWDDVQEFLSRLNKLGRGEFRLPTEAEWEYAAQAGTNTPFAFGRCLSTDQANYDGRYPLGGCPEGEYRKTTVRVGSLPANNWGLHEMHGNVWEWCADWYGEYSSSSVINPEGPLTGEYRVVRGGSWISIDRGARSANRGRARPSNRYGHIGFRLARGQESKGVQ